MIKRQIVGIIIAVAISMLILNIGGCALEITINHNFQTAMPWKEVK